MAKYIHTGKINLPRTALAFILAIPTAVLIGWGYNFLMEISPFILLDLFILLVAIASLAAVTIGLAKIGNIRNRGVQFVLGLLTISLAWYTSWVHLLSHYYFEGFFDFERTFSDIYNYLNDYSISIGRIISSSSIEISGIGMWAISFIEALSFLIIPLYFTFFASKDHFCENCQKFNLHQKFFIHAPHDQRMLDFAESTGNFKELDKFPRLEKLPAFHGSLTAIDNVYKMDLSYCNSCKRNGVINLSRGNYKLNRTVKSVEFESKESVIHNVLVNDSTVATFMNPDKEGDFFYDVLG